MINIFEVAGLPDVQVSLEVSIQVIASLFSGVQENVELVAPDTFVPFIFHWYKGAAPPLMETAVNATDVPAQTTLAEDEIDTPTGSNGLTSMVKASEVAGLPIAQVASEVIKQVISSLLTGA